jgi:hypothetical protein
MRNVYISRERVDFSWKRISNKNTFSSVETKRCVYSQLFINIHAFEINTFDELILFTYISFERNVCYKKLTKQRKTRENIKGK